MSLNQLAIAADKAISAARKDNSMITGTSEPNQVARLVTSLPKLLVDAWHPFVAKDALTISAAFCHAKPRVRWQSPLIGSPSHEPELADLLFIFDVKRLGAVREKRSLLIQAKKSDQGVCKLSTEGDLTQRFMYAHWPSMSLLGVPAAFTLPSPLSLAPPASSTDTQARYACFDIDANVTPAWMIEDSPSTIPPVGGLPSFSKVSAQSIPLSFSLGMGLAQLYSGTLGRRCDIYGDQWTELTEYLENYISQYVPHHPPLKTFPAVAVASGVSPLPLVAARSFFTASPISFPRYSHTRHLLQGMDDWVYVDKLRPAEGGGRFYDWPPYTTPPAEQPWNIEGEGFGVIKVTIDEPLRDIELQD